MNSARLESALRHKYGTRYRRAKGKNGTEFRINCPFCLRNAGKTDKKYKLYMNPQKGVYRCWRCRARGPLTDLFADIALENEEPVFTPRPQLPPEVEPPGILWRLCDLEEDHIALRYLRRRGYNPEVLDQVYGVRYCASGRSFIGGRFDTSNTIIFPVWMDNRLIGWQSRLLYNPADLTSAECAALGFPQDEDGDYDRPPKYFTPSTMTKGKALFNYDMARKSQIVVVTEGPLDAISTGPNAVATFGKGFSADQAALLKTYWSAIIVLLDPGDASEETCELFADLSMSRTVVALTLSGYGDPGEAPTKEIWRQIDIAARAGGVQLENYDWGPFWSANVFKR